MRREERARRDAEEDAWRARQARREEYARRVKQARRQQQAADAEQAWRESEGVEGIPPRPHVRGYGHVERWPGRRDTHWVRRRH